MNGGQVNILKQMKIYKELESLGFFEWLDKTHNLKDTGITPEYLDELPLNDIHRTVANSMAFRWFREKYSDLDFGVAKIHNGTNNYHYHINLAWEFFEGTYEEAELACLRKLIEIVKEKQS